MPELRGLLLLVNQVITEAEKQIALQRTRIETLESMALPAVEERRTLDAMQVLASTIRDNQLAIERLLSGRAEH